MPKKKRLKPDNEITLLQVERIWKELFLDSETEALRKAISRIDIAVFGFHRPLFNIGPRIQCDTYLQIAPKYFAVTEATKMILGSQPIIYLELPALKKVTYLREISVKDGASGSFYMVILGKMKDLLVITKSLDEKIEEEKKQYSIRKILLKIEGLGPKKVKAILSSYSTDSIYEAARLGNKLIFINISGIRSKLAQKIVDALSKSLESPQ